MMAYFSLLAVTFFAALTPGPDILLIARTVINEGIKSALWVILGILTGLMTYITLTVLGLSVIGENIYFILIVSSLGGLYLIFIAISFWNDQSSITTQGDKRKINAWYKSYSKALMVNLSNPKVLIFFSVILTPLLQKGHLPLQALSLLLGSSSAFLTVAFTLSLYRNWFNQKRTILINKISAILFLLFAIKLFHSGINAVLELLA